MDQQIFIPASGSGHAVQGGGGLSSDRTGPLPAFCGLPAKGILRRLTSTPGQALIHPGLKINPVLSRPKEQGTTGPQSGGGGVKGGAGSRRNCQLGAGASHQHGAPVSLLKDRLGRSLKDANAALTFGRSWLAIKPELKIRAAGRG